MSARVYTHTLSAGTNNVGGTNDVVGEKCVDRAVTSAEPHCPAGQGSR